MGKSSISLFSALFLVSVLWKPAYSADQCPISCKGASQSGQQFAPGQKYNYGVEGTVEIYVTGAEKQQTSVKLQGQVSVTSLGNCGHELAVQNLVIAGPDGKKYQSPPGIDKPIQFSLQDGRLGAQICSEDGDTRRSLNIKRAIISLLQSETKSSTQYDIFGACPTEISHSQDGGSVLVHRSRDLSRCAHREQSSNDLVASVFNPGAEIKESQILQSTLNVESKVNHGVPEKVSAVEEYLYRPFSIGENGARASVHTKLTLLGKAAGGSQSHCTVPKTIIFENPHGDSTVPNNVNNVLQAVKETARSVNSQASETSAGNFAQLVRIFRATSKDDLIKAFNQVKGNELEKRVYLDALFRTGTGPSIEASIQILKGNNLSELEQQLVYLSLGNARHVNDEALKAATGLLDQQNLPKEVYLGVGALAGAYCRQHLCHHTKPEGIAALSQKLVSKLGNCKQKNKVEEDNVIAILKGIRNIRHLEDSLIDKLVHAALDQNVRARVKSAVLEAFQADPCSPKIKKASLDILKNRQLDSEIRIKAYLAVIACPCGKSANEIKNLLLSEPVIQVYRFITTSLRAIRASSNPDKQLARQHYGQISTPNKYRVDDRKYSFYREQSFNVDALGIGGSVDETVIFSQDSYLPRSAALNLTAQIFGHSYNVLELGGRQGNLHLVVEHFFGPKGIFRTKGAQALYDEIIQSFQKTTEKVQAALNRGKRSVQQDIDAFDKNLKAEAEAYDNELDLDIYLKFFGTDAIFLSLGNNKGFNFDDIVSQLITLITGATDQARQLSKELRTHLLFIDAELAYPTSTGLPLRLDLTGSATARIDLASNIDINECIKNPQTAKIDIKFIPSTDIEITGILLVDADSVTTGLKVIANLHSSTGVHLVAKVLENGRGIDIQLGLPVDKQEIVVGSNELVFFTAERGHKEKQTKIKTDGDKKEYSGCFDQLSGLLGLTLCGEIALPFAVNGPDSQASITQYLSHYPITGISKVKLVLEKNDLKGYHIRGLVREDAGKASFELLFDAEGSKNRRTQLTGERIFTDTEFGLKLALDSPIKKLAGEISARSTPSELAALIRANIDNDEYYGRVGFNIQGNTHRSVFKPIFEYKLPEQEKNAVQIDGQVVRERNGPKEKYTFEGIKLRLPSSQEPIKVEGFFSSQANARNVEYSLVSDYVTVKGDLKNNDFHLDFSNTLNAVVNFKLKAHSEFGDVIKNEFDLIYSGDCRDQSKRVIFSQYLKYGGDKPENYNIITKNKFEIVSVPFKIQFDGDVDSRKIESDFHLSAPGQKARVELKARTHIKKPEDYSLKLLIVSNKAELEVFSKRDLVNPDKSNFQNYIDIKDVARYELSGVVMHKNNKDVHVGANGHLKITGSKSEDIQFDIGLIRNKNTYSSHAKISSLQGVILDYLLKINQGTSPEGKLNFVLKDAISATGSFKVTSGDGKGNGLLIVDFKQSQRKIKADVKFLSKDPVYNADIDLYLNFEKDNNDKICFSTENKVTEKVLDSKNKLEYAGKTSELIIYNEGVYDIKGKTHANVEIVLPTERCLSFKLDRDSTLNNELYNGHAELVISDSPKRGDSGSTISYRGKVVDTSYEKDIVDYEGQIDLKLKDGQNLQYTLNFKNKPEGEKFKLDLKSEVTGNILPKSASLSASSVYIDSLFNHDDIYNLKANYGSDIGLEVGGTWVVKIEENILRKYVDDFSVSVRLPFEKAHDIKLVNVVIFDTPSGRDVTDYTITETIHINGEQYKVDLKGKGSPRQGSAKVKVLVPHVDPVSLDVSYKTDKGKEKLENFVELKAKYGKGNTAAFAVDSTVTPNGQELVLKASAPQFEQIKKLEITVRSKNPSPDTYSSTLIVDADGRVYKSDSNVVLSKAHPVLDLQYSSPSNPKTSKIYIEGTSLSSTQGKIEVKIANVREISLDLVSEASVQKDNVNIKVQAKSKELGFNNFIGEIVSRDAGSGKRLEFHSTNDGQNVLSGSTSFISKQEGPKTIIEGSGAVKIKDEQKSASFKYIRTVLTEGNEKGVETFFNVAFGDRSYVAESRVTNLEYKNSHVYCEEKKQCAHAEIQSKIDLSKEGVIANIINAGFDLRKLGVAPELGLVVRDEVSAAALPHYTLDLHANKDNRKYHLHVYSTPVYGHSKAGIKVQLPQRTLVLEHSVSYPTDRSLPFPIKGELVLDLDKTRPGHKAAARFLVDLDVENNDKQTAVAEFGFSHPKIDKEALIKISGQSIRTGENSIKIESTATISHSCLGRDRQSKLLFEASPTHVKLIINTPLVKVIDISGSATVQDKLQKGEFRAVLLEGKPVFVTVTAKDFTYYELTTAEADRKLSVVGRIDPEKRIDFTADLILSGQTKNIVHGALFLDNNVVKSDYGMSKENGEYFLNAVRKDLDELEGRFKQLSEKASNDFKDITSRVEPTAQKLVKAYTDDFNKVYKEIADDKVLQELSEAFSQITTFVAKLIDEVIQTTKPIVENIVNLYVDTIKQIEELYTKQIEPQIKQIYEVLAKVLKEYLDGVIELVAQVAAIITDFFEKHKPEFQELTNAIADIFKDLTRLLVAHIKEYRAQIAAGFEEFINYLKDLPIITAIKDKFAELTVPEQVIGLAEQAHATIRPLLPTPESQQFADALNQYVLKKLRKDQCDDAKELRVVYQRLVTAVASLIQYVRTQLGQYGVPTGPGVGGFGFSPVGITGSTPSLGGDYSTSLIKQILYGDIPDFATIIKDYRPRSLNIFEEIPPKRRGIIINGQHYFPFDGSHFTFPGSCRYVLVHDFVDRNFTLAIQLQNGKPQAIILEDKSGNAIELKENGQAVLNGVNHGFPIEQGDSFAFREPNGRVGLGTTYGLKVFCSPKLDVCLVEVSGFYIGKLRGLLGDGNNEPYDDLRLPNGKIVTSLADFANSYRLTRKCPIAAVPAHDNSHLHHLPEACEKVLGKSSSLNNLSPFLNIEPFRQACAHAVSGNPGAALKEACDVARGYVALAVTGLLPAAVPAACLACADTAPTRALGDRYDVGLPAKQADIVVVVETTETNEKIFKDLVVPLVGQVIDALKNKHITDVKVHLAGITSRIPYPIIYDTDAKLKNAKIAFKDESRYDFDPSIKTGNEKVDEVLAKLTTILNDFRSTFGLLNVEFSYGQLFELPLRPGAVKHAVFVIGERVPTNLLTSTFKAVFYDEILKNIAITHSLVAVTDDLTIGQGKNPQTVVGFDNQNVILLGEKKPGKDSEALKTSLKYAENGCIDFTLETSGIVFSSTNFKSLNPGQQKQFLSTASNAIIQELLQDTIEQSCSCSYAGPFHARSICVTKSRKEAARRRK